MKRFLIPLALLLLLPVAPLAMAESPPQMEVRASRMEFENMEQWTAVYMGENVLMTHVRIATLRGQTVSRGFMVGIARATVENLLICAKTLLSDNGHFENLSMYYDPARGTVIRVRRGWLENVYAPAFYVTVGRLSHENLGVSM